MLDKSCPIEILISILDCIAEVEPHECRSTLAALAYSCRFIKEIALDKLWETQVTLVPLIRTLPADLWLLNEEKTLITFRRPLEASDWVRFDYYQRRVRQLGYLDGTGSGNIRVHSDVLRAITDYRPRRVFLPNLRSLVLNLSLRELIPFVEYFIGPNLKHASLDYDGIDKQHLIVPHDVLTVPFSSLARLSPAIQSLTLGSCSDVLCRPLFDHIECFNNLRSLIMYAIGVGVDEITFLSTLPFLEALSHIEVRSDVTHLLTTHGGRFPSLTNFGFKVDDLDVIPNILNGMRCQFEILSIESLDEKHDYQTHLTLFSEIIMTLSRNHLLKDLYIEIGTPENYAGRRDDGDQPVLDALKPLFSLSLRELDLTIPFSGSLDDSWLYLAAKSWPRLETLGISRSYSRLNLTPRFTLEGVISLVTGCPLLWYFRLCLDIKPITPINLDGVCNRHITSIRFGTGSTLLDPIDAFFSLVSMFPNVSEIFWSRLRTSTDLVKRWEELGSLVRRGGPSGIKPLGLVA